MQERTKRAASLKTKGNSAYQQRQFSKAAQLYTQAIQMSVVPEAVFYSNRAACKYPNLQLTVLPFLPLSLGYVNFSPPQHERVVADCDAALKLDRTYIKALNRRATALEALGRLEEAVRGAFHAHVHNAFNSYIFSHCRFCRYFLLGRHVKSVYSRVRRQDFTKTIG